MKKSRKNKLWTKEEIEYLKEHYPKMGASFIAKKLNRTPHSVHVKAAYLKIKYVVPKNIKRCTVKNCNRESAARGFCYYHYQIEYNKGKFKDLETCRYPNCTSFGVRRGYCNTHYSSQIRNNKIPKVLKKWSEEDITFLKENLSDKGKSFVADKLGRSEDAVRHKARKLNIKQHKDINICKMVGCNNFAAHKIFCNECQRLYYKHRITLKQYLNILHFQGGLCGICGKFESKEQNGSIQRLCVDHDHDTGKIRGIICHTCNIGLGLLGDSLDVIIKNLERYNTSRLKFNNKNRLNYADAVDQRKDFSLISRFGINLEEYKDLLDQQSYVCGCCGKRETIKSINYLGVDHVHDLWLCRVCGHIHNGKNKPNKCYKCDAHKREMRCIIRGLSCFRCNCGIGKLGDSVIESIKSVKKYKKNIDHVQELLKSNEL